MSGRWVDLREAAELLGTSTEAVGKRAARGSLRSDRQDGRVLVWVDEGRTEGGREAQADREALIEAKDHAIKILEDQLREEREARRRADMIIAQLTQANAALAQRLPELQSSQMHRETAQGAAEGGGARVHERDHTGDPLGSVRPRDTAEFPVRGSLTRPWWRRAFGG